MNPLIIASLVNTGWNTLQDIGYNLEDPVSDNAVYDAAVRGTAQDRHLVNQLYDLFATGNGLWGTTAEEKEFQNGMRQARQSVGDFSQVKNNQNLQNIGLNLQSGVSIPDKFADPTGYGNAMALNKEIGRANLQTINNFYNQAQQNNQRQLRQNMMNYFDNGGSLEGLNGVTTFNVGSTHENNPNGGIQQGIAPDGLPNTVEEGEVKYEDYIYSNRLKPSKKLLKDNNIPDKYHGLTYADLAKKLQKESEDRPNDPISKATLNEWMSRLANAQETQKAVLEKKKLAEVLNSMSDEEKAAIMYNLTQQQEDIDLSQSMYANGGKIYIKPENRGKFNATKARTGKTTEELTHSKNPLTRKRAIFAQNTAKWNHKHDLGDSLKLGWPRVATNGFGDTMEPNYNLGVNTTLSIDPRYNPTVFQLNSGLDFDTLYNYNKAVGNNNSTINSLKNKKNIDVDNFNLEDLRYMPAVGAGFSALQAALQPKDYSYANELTSIANRLHPISAPAIGGYRAYTPYDVNLGNAENLGLQASALRSARNSNRATQAANSLAVLNSMNEASAKRNITAQQANEEKRFSTDNYNRSIDERNAAIVQAYDQLNSQINSNRLQILAQAAAARDASNAAWADTYNRTHENFFNQLGNVGKDSWNRNQQKLWLEEFLPVLLNNI